MRHLPISGLFVLAVLSVVAPRIDGEELIAGRPAQTSRVFSAVLGLSLCVAAMGIGSHSGRGLLDAETSEAWRKYDALAVLDHGSRLLESRLELVTSCSMVSVAERPEAEPWRDRSAPGRSRRDSPALPRIR